VPVRLHHSADADIDGNIRADVEGDRHGHGNRHEQRVTLWQGVADQVHHDGRGKEAGHDRAAVLRQHAEALRSQMTCLGPRLLAASKKTACLYEGEL
jgi:hypothetical protein